MFSHNIDVRSTDSHTILDENRVRINPSESVIIGDYVWLGIRSTILKGAIIPSNSIVGACSLVTGNFECESNCILAGIPAKVVKRNIYWDRRRLK